MELFKYGLKAVKSTNNAFQIEHFIYACDNDYLEIAKHIYNNLDKVEQSILELIFIVSCQQQRLQMAEWIFTVCPIKKKLFKYACKNGHLNAAKLLMHSFPKLKCTLVDGVIFDLTCFNGHLELAMWLLSVEPNLVNIVNMQMIWDACCRGNLDIVKFIYETGKQLNLSANNEHALFVCSVHNHLHIMKWLLETKPDTNVGIMNERIFMGACHRGNMEIVTWRLSIQPAVAPYYYKRGFEKACMSGQLELAKELFKLNPSFLNIVDAFVAAFYLKNCDNQLLVAKWLTTFNIPVYAFKQVFHNACAHGKLRVAQWVLAECSELSMSHEYFKSACVENHTNIALWLSSIYPDVYNVHVENDIIVSWKVKITLHNQPVLVSSVDICPICNEHDCNVVSKDCNHSFCNDCITIWWNKNSACPLCRTDINSFAPLKISRDSEKN